MPLRTRIHTLLHPCVAAAALALPLAAAAIAPGLWEQSMAGPGGGAAPSPMAGMQAQLASLPPEQRKQMEAMMASKGVAMGSAPGAVRMCITPEKAAGGIMRTPEPGCTQQVLERSATRARFSFECAGPPASKGTADYSFPSDKSYSGTMRLTRGSGAQAESMEMQMSGRWVSADCGSVKPPPEPPKSR